MQGIEEPQHFSKSPVVPQSLWSYSSVINGLAPNGVENRAM